MSETVCPLCSKPRPRGAKRCICNYTFEYERPARMVLGGDGGRRSAGIDGVLVVASVAAGVVAFFLARGVERPPESPWLSLVLALIGAFTLVGAFSGGGWFLRNSRARRFVVLLGAAGARVFYALLGGAFVGGGLGLFAYL